jgi:hypothetical protein
LDALRIRTLNHKSHPITVSSTGSAQADLTWALAVKWLLLLDGLRTPEVVAEIRLTGELLGFFRA